MKKNFFYFIKNVLLRYSIYLLIISIFLNFNIIDKYLNTFNKFSEYTLISIFIFLAILFIVVFFIKNNTKPYSFLYIWKIFLPIFIILVVLFIQNDLSFFKIVSISFLCIIIFDCIYFILKYFILNKINKRKEIKDKIKIFNDNAEEKKDTLGREKIVENLVKLILSIELKESYAFLLSAGWGEGKSSCINFLIKKITDNELHKDLFEFIKINPWFNDTKEKLLNAILGEINYFAKTNYPYKSFESEFDDIIKLSNVKLNNYVEIALQNVLENFTQDKNIQHKIKDIGEILKEEYSKKIIIILDDIDRLSKDNILFIMQIVEMFKQYTNLIFILSGDYNKIEQILCETSEPCVQENGTNVSEIKKTVYYKNYIEKILNVIKLPSIEEDIIKENLRININEILGKEKEINIERFDKYIECSRFRTLRDVKRFCNAFQISYLQVKDKINVYNFINLEILFVFYPEIYKDCLNNKEFWFHEIKIFQQKEIGKIERQKKEEGEQLNEYFSGLIKNYNDYEKDILKRLFSIIIVSNYTFDLILNKAKNREGYYSYFNDYNLIDLYFTHKTPKDIIDADVVEHKFIEWLKIEADDYKLNNSIRLYLDKLNDKKIINFFNLVNYSNEYIKINKALIETFAELSDKFKNINASFIWEHIKMYLSNIFRTEYSIKDFYKTIIKKSTNIVFAIELYQQFIYKSFQIMNEDEKELKLFDNIISQELDKKIFDSKNKCLEQIYELGDKDYIYCWIFNEYYRKFNENIDIVELVQEKGIEYYQEFIKRVIEIKPFMEQYKEFLKFFISDPFMKYLKDHFNSNDIFLESRIPKIVWYIDIWGKEWLTKQIRNLSKYDDMESYKLLNKLSEDYSINKEIIEHVEKFKELNKHLEGI